MQSWQEHALAFECQGLQLVGVLAEPKQGPGSDTGVVIITGGPQYRAGAHRLFVRLARTLAGAGYPTLRFDLRGMGDSEGDFPGFEHTAPDVAAAIEALLSCCTAVRRILLWGLCDGASAALLYLHATRDARVRGLCLANPWVRSAQSLARAHVKHYYGQRLLQREFWRKLARGGIGVGALRSLAADLRRTLVRRRKAPATAATTFQQRMALAWRDFDGALLLLLSGNDYTAKEFLDHAATDPAWRGALARPGLEQAACAAADHTFSGAEPAGWLLQHTLAWVQAQATPAALDAQAAAVTAAAPAPARQGACAALQPQSPCAERAP